MPWHLPIYLAQRNVLQSAILVYNNRNPDPAVATDVGTDLPTPHTFKIPLRAVKG